MATNSDKPSGSDPKPASESSEETVWHRWTFLTNHAHVLIALQANPGMILREVAQEVGITERAVQRIVQELEEEGYLVRHKVGRKNQYEVLSNLPLRHPLECHRTIGDLLQLITQSRPS